MKAKSMIYTLVIMAPLILPTFLIMPAQGAWTDQGLYMKTTDQGILVDSPSKAYLNLDRGTKSEDAWLGFKSAGAYNWLIATGRTGANSDLSFCSYAYNTWDTPLYLQYATGNIGIGTTNPGVQLDVNGNVDISGEVCVGPFVSRNYQLEVVNWISEGHVVCFKNICPFSNADVLLLRVECETPGNNNNFISFKSQDNTAVGNIDGNGAGGVRYRTTGSDFAEYMPRQSADEVIEPGDIVGVTAGKVSKTTMNSNYAQVVSTAPGWVGNCPGEEKESFYEQVAFLGQAPVKVRGEVQAGDFIIPSGLNDGTGVAISPKEMDSDRCGQIVGRTMESSENKNVKLVRSVVGLHAASPALREVSLDKDRQIEELTSRLETLEELVRKLSE